MRTSSRAKSSDCFSGIARLLLCKGSLQTHPSDHITEPNSADQLGHVSKDRHANVKVEAPAATHPGVVARLMGLESLPDTDWVPARRTSSTPGSISRSRSVNFMDYLLEFDLAQAHHRRVRTSVSFREVPTLLNHQNKHDFFFLYLDDVEKTNRNGSKLRKSKVGVEKMKQQKKDEKDKISKVMISRSSEREVTMKKEKNQRNNYNFKFSKLKDEPRQVSNKGLGSCKGAQVSSGFASPARKKDNISKLKSPVKPVNQQEAVIESKLMKKIKNRHSVKGVQSECRSADSSPVSTLRLDEITIHDQMHFSSDVISPKDSNPAEKKFSPKATSLDYPFPHSTGLLNATDDAKCYIDVARKLCRLTEEDIKASNWVAKNVMGLESFEEMFLDFGQQILDLLVKELVQELVDFHMGKFRTSSMIII